MAVSVLDHKGSRGTPRRPRPAAGSRTDAPVAVAQAGVTSWRKVLPTLRGKGLTLREIRPGDAPALLSLITEDHVARFLATPPGDQQGFEAFIDWTRRKRAEGSYACFAVVPRGSGKAAGFFQLRSLDAEFKTAEWGFALGRTYWGTGLFLAGAETFLDFAFGCVGVERLEARAMAANARGNGALRKVGAVPELVLRQAFTKDGAHHDTRLWSILDTDWQARPRANRTRSARPSGRARSG